MGTTRLAGVQSTIDTDLVPKWGQTLREPQKAMDSVTAGASAKFWGGKLAGNYRTCNAVSWVRLPFAPPV